MAICRQPLCAVIAPQHPFRPGSVTTLAAFAPYPAALLTATHGIRQLLGRVEADAGFHLMVNAEAASIDVARRLAIHGGFVTFLPEFAAASEIQSGQVLAVPLSDPLLTAASAHLVVRVRRRLPAVVDQLVGHLIAGMRAFKAGAD